MNCLIEGNVIGGTPNNANYGGGIDCSLVSEPSEPGIVAHIINCTIVGNDATSGRGGGIGFGNKGSSEVVNCIVVDNVARPEATPDGSNIFMGAESTTEVSYTLWPEAESGTGKSSLCSYIIGYRDDYQGIICFDGKNIRHNKVQDWLELRKRSLSMMFASRGLNGPPWGTPSTLSS